MGNELLRLSRMYADDGMIVATYKVYVRDVSPFPKDGYVWSDRYKWYEETDETFRQRIKDYERLGKTD